MKYTLFIVIAMLFVSPVVSAGTNKDVSAEALVTEVAADIATSDRDHLADTVLQNLDIPAIAMFTLGRHAKHLDSETKNRFAEAFESYLRDQITANADQFTGAELNVTKSIKRNARDAIVTTVVNHSGEQVTVRWRVIERKGKWSVVDLEFAGIWLAIEQRAQIAALLDRPGMDIDAVIERFH